jgi:hypothetical protein
LETIRHMVYMQVLACYQLTGLTSG